MKILDWIRNHPRYIKWRYPPGTIVYAKFRDRYGDLRSRYATISTRVIFVSDQTGTKLCQMKDVLAIRKVKKKEEFTARLKGLLKG